MSASSDDSPTGSTHSSNPSTTSHASNSSNSSTSTACPGLCHRFNTLTFAQQQNRNTLASSAFDTQSSRQLSNSNDTTSNCSPRFEAAQDSQSNVSPKTIPPSPSTTERCFKGYSCLRSLTEVSGEPVSRNPQAATPSSLMGLKTPD